MTVRVGVVGCGFIGTLHSRALRALVKGGVVDAAVEVTCDADPERAAGFARPHGARPVTDPFEAIAAVDAVWLCTPTVTHRPLVEAAAAAGVAVFCEKPLATTLADAEAMAGMVAAAGVVAQVGLVLRHAPVLVDLAGLVAGGGLGRPMAVVFRDDQYFPVQGQYASAWRGDVAVAGGGTLLEHSIHDIDILRWLLGEVDEVTAMTANFAGHPGIEDVAVATMRFASGATASLTSVWHQVLARGSTRRIEVIGERGIAWLDDEYLGPLHVETDAGTEERAARYPPWAEALPYGDPAWTRYVVPHVVAARGFLDALASGRPAAPGLEVGVAAHRVAEAVYRSAAAGGEPVRPALL